MRARKALMMAAAGVVVAGGLAVAPFSFAAQAPGNGCADVELIGVRASTERPGVGATTTLVSQQLTRASKQTVKTTAVDYPATLGNYQNSVRQGVTALAKDIQNTASTCPGTKIALSGHSQGAQVIGDALLGSARGFGNGGPAVDQAAASKVVAITLFGDPTFTPKDPIDVNQNLRGRGTFSRGAGKTGPIADIAKSFCNNGDTFCQSGANLAAHLNYRNSVGDATDFIVQQVGG
jgi:hypothetical protein